MRDKKVETEYAAQFSDYLRRHGLEGVVVVAGNGKILSANRVAESLLDYGAGQLTNLNFSDVWVGSYPPSRTSLERSRPQETELIRRNGEALPVSLAVTPVNGSAESERLVSFVSRQDLDRFNESLLHAQRLAGIGTLTASVAHELTNPISIITAACANLIDELGDESVPRDELLQSVQLIEQSAFRCARIVEVLRNYAHNMGQQDGDGAIVAITSPAAILQDALTMVEQQFRKQARVTVETDLQPSLTTVFCDHHRVAQVLINLLINARDAMQPQGGVVRVRFWTPDLTREPELAARYRAGRAIDPASANGAVDLFAFSIADSGVGIVPAIADRIFEPFFTTKPAGQGTGLGLFIARGIVAQHGGCLYAENNPQGGATFTAVLPRKQ
jgi:signal transduction histidine kinase